MRADGRLNTWLAKQATTSVARYDMARHCDMARHATIVLAWIRDMYGWAIMVGVFTSRTLFIMPYVRVTIRASLRSIGVHKLSLRSYSVASFLLVRTVMSPLGSLLTAQIGRYPKLSMRTWKPFVTVSVITSRRRAFWFWSFRRTIIFCSLSMVGFAGRGKVCGIIPCSILS